MNIIKTIGITGFSSSEKDCSQYFKAQEVKKMNQSGNITFLNLVK